MCWFIKCVDKKVRNLDISKTNADSTTDAKNRGVSKDL